MPIYCVILFPNSTRQVKKVESDFSTSAVTVVDEAANLVDEQDAWGGAERLKQTKDAQGKSSGFIALDDDEFGKY